ncbi:hypothetical protein FH587_04615 (plasmid) [Leptospira interrogans]|uniref:hypothetical protein n=1 Tax=Leptospira interrogans TaxID=173 RepID=UPI001F081331|nr:hypothetical protein [Leptospira interrogans]UML83126.1 hypothetical protein FH587_04615 [Leptospira interrogans]
MTLVKAIKTLKDGTELPILVETGEIESLEKRGDIEILEPLEEDSGNSKKGKKTIAKQKVEPLKEDSQTKDSQGVEGQ